jgi:hypothetical protein
MTKQFLKLKFFRRSVLALAHQFVNDFDHAPVLRDGRDNFR